VKVLCSLGAIIESPLVQACGFEFKERLVGVMAMVESLEDGVGPKREHMLSFSNLYVACMKKLENFCKIILPGDPAPKTLVGRRALTFRVDSIKASLEAGKLPVMDDLTMLRTFSWMLDPAQFALHNAWIHQASKLEASMLQKQIEDEKEHGKDFKKAECLDSDTTAIVAVSYVGSGSKSSGSSDVHRPLKGKRSSAASGHVKELAPSSLAKFFKAG
jgi:hypothetical protein